jgi:glycoside/pentoside/hexuronide:cation symporter, GPH family
MPEPFSTVQTLRYGMLAAPLALVGLPLYVYLPSLFAQSTGLGLVTIGSILLGARALEALADPWLGRAIAALHRAKAEALPVYAAVIAAVMAVCVGLTLQSSAWLTAFDTPITKATALAVCVALAYMAYSWLTIAHHTLGTSIIAAGTPATRLYSTREALALGGVLLGSILPLVMGWAAYGWVTAALLGLGVWLLQPQWRLLTTPTEGHASKGFTLWQDAFLRRSWVAFFISNISGSLPATLLGFYVADVLGLGTDATPKYLAVYFVFAALGFAAWPKLATRFGAVRVWAFAMAANGVVFAATAFLGSGAPHVAWVYGAVCACTGLLLGGELMLPQAIVASRLAVLGQAQAAGSVFGWWTFAQKTALALAAGVGLWGLAWLGYLPNVAATAAPLVWLYCIIPCVLKLLAAGLALTIKDAIPPDRSP